MGKRNGTFSKIYIQLIFAVKYREALLFPEWENELYSYISGIIQNKDQLSIAINGHYDHMHMLVAIRPACRLSDLVMEIKKASTSFINAKRFVRKKFHWQESYGAFSYSRWDVDMISAYIRNQKEHHRKKSFREKYLEVLEQFDIEFNSNHLFTWLDTKEQPLSLTVAAGD